MKVRIKEHNKTNSGGVWGGGRGGREVYRMHLSSSIKKTQRTNRECHTLIFCDGDSDQLKYLSVILIFFEAISGLHINWYKSFIYHVN